MEEIVMTVQIRICVEWEVEAYTKEVNGKPMVEFRPGPGAVRRNPEKATHCFYTVAPEEFARLYPKFRIHTHNALVKAGYKGIISR